MWKNILIIVLLLIIASGGIYLYSIQTGDNKKPPVDGEIVMEDSLFLRPEFREVLDKYIEIMDHQGHLPRVAMIFPYGKYLTPEEGREIEQSFLITHSKYRSQVEPRRPIAYFRYKNNLFLICSSVYSILGDRNGIMKSIEKDLQKLQPEEPILYHPATWLVKVKIRDRKVKVEYEPYIGTNDIFTPPPDLWP
ncbi:MAG: hypothetical protein HF300_17840 [Ignavibacteria bacterium]|jgi:hypothetical protein|nr:hypothetical protein [Ignavibacteria bacterium]MCU7514426.1 hypothetical protein [Ignavibacteria bacterium]MCU7526638.1 hypothetical protein [Ignavibacteria bacterium]